MKTSKLVVILAVLATVSVRTSFARGIVSGEVLESRISNAAQLDTYTFSAKMGETVQIRMACGESVESIGSGKDLGNRFQRFFQDKRLLPTIDLRGPDGAGIRSEHGRPFAEMTAKLENSGTYTIICRSGDGIGPYSVFMLLIPDSGSSNIVAESKTDPVAGNGYSDAHQSPIDEKPSDGPEIRISEDSTPSPIGIVSAAPVVVPTLPENVGREDAHTHQDEKNLALADALLKSGSQYLDSNGNWTDVEKARPIYDQLAAMDGLAVTRAIERRVIRNEERLRVLFLAVKLGISGSEERLNDVLRAHGDKSMAEDYLNSGSSALYDGGKRWANAHGYSISTGNGSHRVRWGRF